MITLTQLEYIVAVDKFRHFGQAARACHISQPSLSMQIQKAEEELKLVLFDRIKKPVLHTEEGKAFIEQAKVVLREHAKLLATGRAQTAELRGDFRLAVIPTLAPYLVPRFIEEFSQKFPHVKLKIDELKTESILAELKNDTLDAGLLATPLSESGITEDVLFYEPFYLYLSPRHPLLKKRRVSEKDLDAGQMWLLQDGHCLRNQVISFCSIRKEQPVFKNVEFEGANLETLRYLVQQNQGYTMIPHLFAAALPTAERRAQVREFVGTPPQREVSLVHHREQWKHGVLRALHDCILHTLPPDLAQRSTAAKKKGLLSPE